MHYLITGATGFVGGHLAEACVARGQAVSTIARAASDTALLDRLGVTIHRGDLTDPEVVRRAVEGAEVIAHCAAKVGDVGPVADYRAVNVEGLRTLLEACEGRPLHRFVHLSSLGVYEARHHHGTDESEPLPEHHLDSYTQSKVEAEHLALRYHKEHGVPVVVLRPGFVYGPRDRTVLPRLIERLRTNTFHYLGGDQRVLNTIYVGNLVGAVFLAVDRPEAVGQVYNLTDGEPVTRQRFMDTLADGLGLPRPHRRLPRWLAAILVRILRRQIRRAAPEGKTPVSHAQLKFLTLDLDFSIDKARRELGYRPRLGFDEAMRETLAWYRDHA